MDRKRNCVLRCLFGSNYVHTSKETSEVSIKQTHIATKTVFIQSKYFCIIYGVSYYNLAENLTTQLFMG